MIMLNIEPTDFCNAKCFYCVQGKRSIPPHSHRGGLLPLELHGKIFEGLNDFLEDPLCMPAQDNDIYLRYCGVGEPTLHPRFFSMYQQALSFPKVKILAVLSNGTGWNQCFTDAFVEASLARKDVSIELVFSLDTLREDVQFRIKQMRNIGSIVGNLRYLLDSMVKTGARNIHPVFQMIALKENLDESGAFLDLWRSELGSRGMSWRLVRDASYTQYFRETQAFIWAKCLEGGSSQEEARDLHRAALARMERSSGSLAGLPPQREEAASHPSKPVCGVLWYGINVAASGDVSPCCLDTDFKLKVGNIRHNSLAEIYLSDKMLSLRQAHVRGALANYPLCQGCDFLQRAIPACEADIRAYRSREVQTP